MKTNATLLARAERHLYPNYRPGPFVLERGRGCELWDVEGKRYLDLSAGVAVCSVGHAHPKYVRALSEQVATLGHVSNWFYNARNIEAAERLVNLSGMDRAFFCNSGCEANEAMLKLARHHFYGKGERERLRVIAFDNAFHGRTLGALSMTGTPKYREGFGPLGPVTHVPYGDLDAVRRALGPDVAGIIVEPVQGEGGVEPAPRGFLQGLRELCDSSGALLLLDEVQTGIGRLGVWFGYQRAQVVPDAVAVAKGLGGGFPVGALLVRDAFAGALPPGTHGSTFGGNPLGAAAILSVISIIEEEGLLPAIAWKGVRLADGLAAIVSEFPRICELRRGEGLLQGLVLRPGLLARDAVARAWEMGYLIIGAGERVLRFAPPLVITEQQIDEALDATRRLIGSLG
ncbi:MAG TPA: acetylornithine/succinylornithine family transaminase [Polyangiaceae bacterium]|nr:acetylornithine/succinylornithine family transaminase [Polyangiaceae bacterium]